MFLIGALAIGWQTEITSQKVGLLTEKVGENVEAMCILQENNAVSSGIAATSYAERNKNEQEIKEQAKKLHIEKKKAAKKKVSASAVSDNDREILLRIVEAEAGDQDIRGRRLVANVILNRVKSKEFPNTVKAVVFSPRQFSPVSDGSYYRVKVSNATKKAVAQALNGRDDSEGALYFMWREGADSTNASWFDRSLTKLFTYGCHEFFR
jgi:N-acetylmuramoyl-L-alanine amidase